MAEDWLAIAADVDRGILEIGVPALLVRRGIPSDATYSPVRGEEVTAACTIVYSTWEHGQVDGTLVLRGDLRILMSASGLVIDADEYGENSNTPSTADRLRDGDREYQIVSVSPLAPAGVPLLWELQCRA